MEINLIGKIQDFFKKDRDLRMREFRALSASGALRCRRDLYWQIKGEPETDPVDMLGSMRMAMGNAVENYFMNQVLQKLHFLGVHVYGGQIKVGGNDPDWDGLLDFLAQEKKADGTWGKKFVGEIKVKTGVGGNMLLNSLDPGKEYLAQLGLYLSDTHKKLGISDGMFLFFIASDANFGQLAQIDCTYDSKSDTIIAYHARTSTGTDKEIYHSLCLKEVRERMKGLYVNLKSNVVPPGDYQYKYPLTPERLASYSDKQIRDAVNGNSVIGDWQVKYSQYKTKQLTLDKVWPGYTEEEIGVLRAEYLTRHPKSKL